MKRLHMLRSGNFVDSGRQSINHYFVPDIPDIIKQNLFSWGWNPSGQLGDGTTTNRLMPTLIGTDTWIAISGGGFHSLGLRSDGRLFAWGSNLQGQLGDGTTTDRHTPTLIGTDTWIAISGGAVHSLGLR